MDDDIEETYQRKLSLRRVAHAVTHRPGTSRTLSTVVDNRCGPALEDGRQIRAASDTLLEEMHERDRVRALARLEAGEGLTDYERGLVGIHAIRNRQAIDNHRRDVLAQQQASEQREAARREAVASAIRPSDIVFRSENLERLNAHAISLAVERGLTVVCSGVGGDASCTQDSRTITCPPVTDESSYATFLHEFGHTMPAGDSRQYRHCVTSTNLIAIGGEVGAWRWAIDHALRWTRDMADVLCQSLTSYLAHATTSDEREAIADCIACSQARVSGPGALPPWRQQSYAPGDRVVHKGMAWTARVSMHEYSKWPEPGDEPVCWGKGSDTLPQASVASDDVDLHRQVVDSLRRARGVTA